MLKNFSVNLPFSKGMAVREKEEGVLAGSYEREGRRKKNGCLVFLSSSREKEEGRVWVFLFLFFFMKKEKKRRS